MSKRSTVETQESNALAAGEASCPTDPDPAGWLAGLKSVHERLKPFFISWSSWSTAGGYLVGLLSDAKRKNSWQMAEMVGARVPYAFQHLLGDARWDADGVRDVVRAYVVENLHTPSAVGVLDETDFVKQGKKSVGVQRMYSGSMGKKENCQVAVFLAYASAKGAALIDRALFVPEVWAEDGARRAEAGVPEAMAFHKKSELGRTMLARAFEAGVRVSWVTGDENYGISPDLRSWLETEGVPYVLAVASNHYVWQDLEQKKAEQVLAELPTGVWHHLSAGAGSKGPRFYDWAVVPINGEPREGWRRWLLFRKNLEDGKIAYYVVAGPGETPLAEMVRVAGTRWMIETCFEQGKQEVGLGQYQVRSWTGWHRHITLSMLALAYLVVMRKDAVAPQKGGTTSKKPSCPRRPKFVKPPIRKRSPMAEFKRERALQDRLLKAMRHRSSG